MFRAGSRQNGRCHSLCRVYHQGMQFYLEIMLIDREIMIPLIRVFRLMDDGSISMQVADNDLSRSFNPGETSNLKNVLEDYWICSLCLSFSMPEQVTYGNSLRNRTRNMVAAKVWELRAWICLRRECSVVTNQILIELMVQYLFI